MVNHRLIDVIYFDFEANEDFEEGDFKKEKVRVKKVNEGIGVQISYSFSDERKAIKEITNNPILLLATKEEVESYINCIGKCEYTFRKGVGYVGEVFRLKYWKHDKERNIYVFKLFDKRGNRLIESNKLLELEERDLQFVYPLVLSPDLREDGFKWSGNYIIFPYNYGEKKPVEEKILKEKAPRLYNHLSRNRDRIEKQSKYNDRIQFRKEFYSLIRVGDYCYGKFFVAFRDNTKLNACVIEHITTHWKERKNPIFDGHISYTKVSSVEEANYIVKKLRDEKVLKLIELLFDSRSISLRLPIKLPKWIPK